MRYSFLTLCLVIAVSSAAWAQSTPTCHSEGCACWWLVLVDDNAAPHQPVFSPLAQSLTGAPPVTLLNLDVVQGRPSCSGSVENVHLVGFQTAFANDTATGSARIQIVHKNPCSDCDQPTSSTETCAAWIAGQSAPTASVYGVTVSLAAVYQRTQMMASFRKLSAASQTLQHFIDLNGMADGEAVSLAPLNPFIPLPLTLPAPPLNPQMTAIKIYPRTTLALPTKVDQAYTTWEEVVLFGYVTTSLSAQVPWVCASRAECWLRNTSHNVEVDFGCNCSGASHVQPLQAVDLGFGVPTPANSPTGGGTGNGVTPLGPGPARASTTPLFWMGGTVPAGPTPINGLGEPIGLTPVAPWYVKGSPYPFTGGRISLHRTLQ